MASRAARWEFRQRPCGRCSRTRKRNRSSSIQTLSRPPSLPPSPLLRSTLIANPSFHGKPSWFAHMFVLETEKSCGHDSTAAEVADGFSMVGAINYRQASDVVAQHLRGSLGDEFVGVRNHKSSAA